VDGCVLGPQLYYGGKNCYIFGEGGVNTCFEEEHDNLNILKL